VLCEHVLRCWYLPQPQMLSSKSSFRTEHSPVPKYQSACCRVVPHRALVQGSSEFPAERWVLFSCCMWHQFMLLLSYVCHMTQ
jgi:hypothetical protein